MINNVRKKLDGSFVIDLNGLPFHANEADTPDVFQQVVQLVNDGLVEVVDYIEPTLPQPTPEEQLAAALGERRRLLSESALLIAPLQDAVDLGEATEQEGTLLEAWKRYRIELLRIDQQPEFPAEITWPIQPPQLSSQA